MVLYKIRAYHSPPLWNVVNRITRQNRPAIRKYCYSIKYDLVLVTILQVWLLKYVTFQLGQGLPIFVHHLDIHKVHPCLKYEGINRAIPEISIWQVHGEIWPMWVWPLTIVESYYKYMYLTLNEKLSCVFGMLDLV